jgi:hypothetical protein|tara:strand:+ start:933 stop:1118 length:186 start_codon:yes stop_codon:yes gene_type:complete
MNVKQERFPPLRIQADQGYHAFYKGWLANHYNPNSMAGKEWQKGFDYAYFENIDRLKSPVH